MQQLARLFFSPEQPVVQSVSKPVKTIAPCLHTMQVSQQEADAFRMKAITNMKDEGILFNSISEQQKILRSSPILAISDSSDAPIVSCYQILTHVPGKVIVLQGAFKRNGDKPSTPLVNQFQVTKLESDIVFFDP